MYYDASGSDYISTPSFAIPNTGILTIEAWMKSVLDIGDSQSIIGDAASHPTIGYILMRRTINTDNLYYAYSDGAVQSARTFTNFFQNLDNQWVHIVEICDYTGKTLKAYRNGVQFGATQNLTGTPLFPLTDRIKYVGSYYTNAYNLTDGSLDEVRIYNRGLSAEEIAGQYGAMKGKYQ